MSEFHNLCPDVNVPSTSAEGSRQLPQHCGDLNAPGVAADLKAIASVFPSLGASMNENRWKSTIVPMIAQ
jgi:hypothetical protein